MVVYPLIPELWRLRHDLRPTWVTKHNLVKRERKEGKRKGRKEARKERRKERRKEGGKE
jgi:hypothetical protein